MNIDYVVAQYREQHPLYVRFTKKLRDLLEELLGPLQIEYGIIDSRIDGRTKEIGSLRKKIDGKSYVDPLGDITDLSALRIVLHKLSDIPKVTRIIRKAFAVDA